MQSLREKLLKAGLVTEEQAKKATEEAARPPPKRPSAPSHDGKRDPPTFIVARPQARAAAADVPKLPPLPGSKAHQRLEAKKQLELDRKIREVVQEHQVALEAGEQAFYFATRKGKLRRLELSPVQAQLLENGTLAVAERPEPSQIEHSLVSSDAVPHLLALSEKAVRFFNRPESPIGFLSEDELTARKGEADVPEPADWTEPAGADGEADGAISEKKAPESSEPSSGQMP